MTGKRLATIAGVTLLIAIGIPWLAIRVVDLRCWHRYGGQSRFAGLEEYLAYRAVCSQPYPNRF